MQAIIGLGNPGSRYNNTPHNAGFIVVDIVRNLSGNKTPPKTLKKMAVYWKLGEVLIAKPLTFMNASGRALTEIKRKFRLEPRDIIVIHDDLDLKLGEFKFSFAKSGRNHKGILSINSSLKTKDYWRLRIGVAPEERPLSFEAYLLSKLKGEDLKKFKKTAQIAAAFLEGLLRN